MVTSTEQVQVLLISQVLLSGQVLQNLIDFLLFLILVMPPHTLINHLASLMGGSVDMNK